jgi:hypothetical protein
MAGIGGKAEPVRLLLCKLRAKEDTSPSGNQKAIVQRSMYTA